MSTSSDVGDFTEDPNIYVHIGYLRCEHHRSYVSCGKCIQIKCNNSCKIKCCHQLRALACEKCSEELTVDDPDSREKIPYVLFLIENRLSDFKNFLKCNNREWFDKISEEKKIEIDDSKQPVKSPESTDCESMVDDNDDDPMEVSNKSKEPETSSDLNDSSVSSDYSEPCFSSFPERIWVKKTARCLHSEVTNKCKKCLADLNKNKTLGSVICCHNESAFFCSECYSLYEVKGSKLTVFEATCQENGLSLREIKLENPKIFADLQAKNRLPIEEEKPQSPSFLKNFPQLPEKTEPKKRKMNDPKKDVIETNHPIKTNFKKTTETPSQGPSKNANENKKKTGPNSFARIKMKENFLCQHNKTMTLCNYCSATNLKELELRSKCLHRISPTKCNHCRDKIYILKKEKERTKLKNIKEEDYIPYRIYEKIYLSNVVNKKFIKKNQDNNNQNLNKEEINQTTQGNIKKPEPKLRKIQPEPQTNNNKRDFSKLDDFNTEPMEVETKINSEEIIDPTNNNTNSLNTNSLNISSKEPLKKPPPIFILKENPEEIRKTIDGYEIENFTLKVVSNKQIKVNMKREEDFKFFLFKLSELEVEHYTFQAFNGKVARRIIRGLPVDFDINILKSELEKFEFLKIKNIVQLRNKFTKNPIPLFKIEFKSYEKIWEKLEKIKVINNYEITFERLGIKQIEIPICGICLQYGHTKNFCKSKLVCIICNDNHHSKVCPIPDSATLKNEIWRPTCLHCKEAHFTHWKGCKVYKKLRNQRIKKYKELNEECKKLAVEEKRPADIDKRDGILTPNNNNRKDNKPNDEIKKLKIEIKNLEAKRLEEISHLKKDILSLKKEIAELKLMLTSH